MQKVMLAEDDATMLSLLSTLLKMEGFETTTLSTQEDVLNAVRRDQPDVILLDVNLAQGNGIDFLRQIRQADDLRDTVVIMSSGMPLEAESMKAGANAFLLKPYMPDTLINTIKNGISNH
jgi:DNA-binding response OmpR family regulator